MFNLAFFTLSAKICTGRNDLDVGFRFIKTLPGGYNMILNEEASNISQGQKQLFTIARVILKNPAILILDEATSSIDTRTETLIQKAMKNIMQGRTSFVIAHRLSTISDANLILVMKGGDIIEQGNHQQLFGANGFYADLYNSQFSEGQYVKENEIIGYVEHLETFRSPFHGLVVRSYVVQNQAVWSS